MVQITNKNSKCNVKKWLQKYILVFLLHTTSNAVQLTPESFDGSEKRSLYPKETDENCSLHVCLLFQQYFVYAKLFYYGKFHSPRENHSTLNFHKAVCWNPFQNRSSKNNPTQKISFVHWKYLSQNSENIFRSYSNDISLYILISSTCLMRTIIQSKSPFWYIEYNI